MGTIQGYVAGFWDFLVAWAEAIHEYREQSATRKYY